MAVPGFPLSDLHRYTGQAFSDNKLGFKHLYETVDDQQCPGHVKPQDDCQQQSHQCLEYHLGHKPEHNAAHQGRGDKNDGFARGAQRLTDGRFNRSLVLILCNNAGDLHILCRRPLRCRFPQQLCNCRALALAKFPLLSKIFRHIREPDLRKSLSGGQAVS